MRNTFAQTLTEIAARDPRVWLITGDIGFSVLEPFAQAFPDRFINAGVAEQNMMGVASGIARGGDNTVFVYSIANFPTLRCLEQIRNDVCYHKANVKVVAVGAGTAYGPNGYTHHGIEDLGILQTLPNLSLWTPADPVETRLATEAIASTPGPAYLRLEKSGEPTIHTTPPLDYKAGHALRTREGSDVTFLCLGGVTYAAGLAADELAQAGIRARVLSMATFHPLDEEAILDAARATRHLVCVEEHRTPAPLLSAVAILLMQSGLGGECKIVGANLGVGVADVALTQAAHRAKCGLDVQGLIHTARKLVSM